MTSNASNRKLAKRACDGCKIRKIRCTEVAPCHGCMAAGIACTFVRQPLTRGPRHLRKSTLNEITQSQQQWEDSGFGSREPDAPVVHTRLDAESVFAPNKIAALVLQLCVYRLRMYPVWPIIKVERLVASLQKPDPDIEVFALAFAVAAATISRIRSRSSTQPGLVTAEMMETQCQHARMRRDSKCPPDLTTVRIPFFLHMYHENSEPGGLRSTTYLREAITVAHMIGLHRETYYSDVLPEEQEIRRRTLWLLFVAERNVAISHKLPVTIRTRIAFPGTIDSDSEHVLIAYQKLVKMFWDLDSSGVFELLDRCDFDFSVAIGHATSSSTLAQLASLRERMEQDTISMESIEDTQALDLLVTRHWMRIILWRLTQTQNRDIQMNTDRLQQVIGEALGITEDLLIDIVYTPEDALEAHGSTFETKIFEIGASVVESIYTFSTTIDISDAFAGRIKKVLSQLQSLLSHNQRLEHKLRQHIDQARNEAWMHPSILFALSSASEAFDQSTRWTTPLGVLESSKSHLELLSDTQQSLSSHARWSAQERVDTLPETSDTLTMNSQLSPFEGTLEQNHSAIDWTQHIQVPENASSVSTGSPCPGVYFPFTAT